VDEGKLVTMHLLHIQHVVFLFLCMLLILTNAGMYRGIGGVRHFLLYNAALLVGATAVMLRGQIPDVVSILGGTSTFLVSYYFLLRGLEDLFGKSHWQRIGQGVLMVIGIVAMLQYGYLRPDTSERLLLFSLILGLQQWNAALLIFFRTDRARRKAGLPMAIMLLMVGLANLIRLAGIHSMGVPNNYLQSGIFLQGIVITTTCLQCGIMVAYVWITMALVRQDLEVQASTDALTGLLNRRAIEMIAARELELSRKRGSQVCALAVDLDGFKRINDMHGHHCGDAVLVAVSGCLRTALRDQDQLARVGGDEFMVILPETNLEIAMSIAEQVRFDVAALEIPYSGKDLRITASVGFAELNDSSATGWDHLMMRCDQALYMVKRTGGNQALTSTS
jgi:diguanylate cyclase (GGDEF)-like protein